MTPQPQTSAPWWQTLAAALVNLAVSAIVQHYFGNAAAGASVVAGTAIAHALPSPNDQK